MNVEKKKLIAKKAILLFLVGGIATYATGCNDNKIIKFKNNNKFNDKKIVFEHEHKPDFSRKLIK